MGYKVDELKNNLYVKEIEKKIKECRQSRQNITMVQESGLFDNKTKLLLNEIEQKEKELITQYVKLVHITQNGELRSIKQHMPTKGEPRVYWHTKLETKERKKAQTKEDLYYKLYLFYSGDNDEPDKVTFDDLFHKILKQKESSSSTETIKRIKHSYKSFFSTDCLL